MIEGMTLDHIKTVGHDPHVRKGTYYLYCTQCGDEFILNQPSNKVCPKGSATMADYELQSLQIDLERQQYAGDGGFIAND